MPDSSENFQGPPDLGDPHCKCTAAGLAHTVQHRVGKTHCQSHQDPSKSISIFLRETEANLKMVSISHFLPPPSTPAAPRRLDLGTPAREGAKLWGTVGKHA